MSGKAPGMHTARRSRSSSTTVRRKLPGRIEIMGRKALSICGMGRQPFGPAPPWGASASTSTSASTLRLASVLSVASGIASVRSIPYGESGRALMSALPSHLLQNTFHINGQMRQLWVSVQESRRRSSATSGW